ncbi:MAG: hypothetical protein AAGD15_08410 [Agrobacterium cavarae]|uniref:hypothetical protein n=1 Tax=Agrobacterium cavarae TaxID=2528239 RepID=UPI0031B14E19
MTKLPQPRSLVLYHVPLNRTFHELTRYAGESDDVDLSQAFYVSTPLSWEELLKEYRLIILSEAGSGKTEEMRQTAIKLRDTEKDAFFLRLENIPAHFEDAFEVGTSDKFDEWLASGREGWLLLDSVDEARLRHPQDFELAIKILGNRIKLALDRTHIVLTGRVSAWRPKTDLEKARRYLPFTPIVVSPDQLERSKEDLDEAFDIEDLEAGQGAAKPRTGTSTSSDSRNSVAPFRIVTLDALGKEQVKLFAQARGVADTNAFADAIERADAWSFTTRPQDLEDLVAFWLDRGEIGGRLAIMRNSIDRRLRERDQNRDDSMPLSLEKALTGARLLAAATTLGNHPAIQIPDEIENLQGISVEKLLPSWTAKERKTLLQRPIFDPPLYGAVRFHHRTVREYLTAEWLKELLEHPRSRKAIEDIFFRTQYGVEIIIPASRPVLPWLALFDEKIRERVRRIAPEVLFEGGDPAKLPLQLRRQILAQVTSEIARDNTPKSPTNTSAVQRFANVDLAADIDRLLDEHDNSEDAVEFLIHMIWLGQIGQALPKVKARALRPNSNLYTRITAFRAVREIGSSEDMKDIRTAILSEESPIRRKWLAELIGDLTGTPDDTEWLLAALARVERREHYSIDSLADATEQFVARARIDQLPDLLRGFRTLLATLPHVNGEYAPVSKTYTWLLQPSAEALERLARARHPAALTPPALSILRMMHSSKHFDSDLRDIKTNLADLVPSWPELNRANFWSEIEEARASFRGNPIVNHWQASVFGQFWKFAAEDFEYLISQISDRPLKDDRLVALSAAFESYTQGGRRREQYERLKAATQDDPVLLARFRTLMDPPPRRELSPIELRWQRQSRARERQEKTNKTRAREQIQKQIATIRDPGFPNPNEISKTQWYLLKHVREASDRTGKWSTGDWRSLIPGFGDDVARAFRDGAIAHWRKATPQLRSEGAEANETSASAVFGLTGLAIDANETPNWENALSEQEVVRASRFATHELNGFPEWFPRLYSARAPSIDDLLMQEVKFEISHGGDDGMHYIVDDLAWSGQWSWPTLGPRIFEILRTSEPRHAETLNKLLSIVVSSGIYDADLANLAGARIAAASRHLPQWYAVWTGVEPEQAIAAFGGYLDRLPDDEARTDAAMRYITHLFGDQRHERFIARDHFRRPKNLRDLYILMHRHVKRGDDIDRTNGEAYSPTLRDRAQDARNALFNVLNEIEGKEAYIAMIEIAGTESDASARSWIRFRAQQKAEREGNLDPWTVDQVREFDEKQDRTPGNHRDLADLVVNRILDLKDDLENGYSSIASILISVNQETDMRKFLERDFREKALGRYSIPQEEELADAKRPDLRFHGAGFDGPVPVELKLSDLWTGPALFERLENQLSGDYLKDRRSSRGVFLMVHQGKKRSWELPGGSSVDFDGLVEALKARWLEVSPSHPQVDELTIIGIDLTKQ